MSASLAVVGEAPGLTEIRKGRPFCGPSGELLVSLLKGLGVDPQDVCALNTISCGVVRDEGRKDRALQCCHKRLVMELEERASCGLKRVVLFGNYALRALTSESPGITKVRGRRLELSSPKLAGLDAIAALHPAASLRQPLSFADTINDVKKILSPVHQLSILRTPLKLWICDSTDDAAYSLRRFAESQYEFLQFDIETTGFDSVTDSIVCIVLCNSPTEATVLHASYLQQEPVRSLLESVLMEKKLIGHNLKFDVNFIYDQYGYRPPMWDDTMLMHYLIDERRGTHGLKDLCRQYFDAPDWEAPIRNYYGGRKKRPSYGELPWRLLSTYCGQDGIYNYRLWMHLKQEIAKEPRKRQWLYRNLLMPCQEIAASIAGYGILIDCDARDELEGALTQDIEERARVLREMVGEEGFNPNSPQQIARFLFDEVGIRPNRRYGRSTQVDALELYRSETPFIGALLDYRRVMKFNSSWVKPLTKALDWEDRIHPQLQVHGTVTGRMVMKNPPLQTIPRSSTEIGRKIRNLFLASPGMVLLAIDYSQNELRAFASLSQDPYLCSVFTKGEVDLHTQSSITLFGDADGGQEQRHAVKRVTYGLLYGRGLPSFMVELRQSGQSPAEAKDYIDRFYDMMKTGIDWLNEEKRKAVEEGMIETIFGRRRHFPLVTNSNQAAVQREAAAMHPQSVGSDLTAVAMIRVQELLEEEEWGRVLMMVHDELVVEVWEDVVDEAAAAIVKIMRQVPKEFIPNAVPWVCGIGMGERWGDVKD